MPSHSDPGQTAAPLTPDEEVFWRALMRLTVLLPRVLGSNLERNSGLSGTQYALLMHLSEAPNRCLRMSELADRMGFSAGRITRIVDAMNEVGWTRKIRAVDDGRGMVAELTPSGFAVFERTYPLLLEVVHTKVFDHLTRADVDAAGRALQKVVASAEDERARRPGRTGRPTAAAPGRIRRGELSTDET